VAGYELSKSTKVRNTMRTYKKLDPYQRLERIEAAGELQWDINQAKVSEAGATPMSDRDRKIYMAGWTQGAGWAHKAIADEILLRATLSWKPHSKYAHLTPYPAEADGHREFPDGSVDTCYRVLLSFLEMTGEALAMPEMDKPELAANKAICQFLCEDFKRALNAIETTDQLIGKESSG
jgi:hypothetical protein